MWSWAAMQMFSMAKASVGDSPCAAQMAPRSIRIAVSRDSRRHQRRGDTNSPFHKERPRPLALRVSSYGEGAFSRPLLHNVVGNAMRFSSP
jgi:hypothetical protein